MPIRMHQNQIISTNSCLRVNPAKTIGIVLRHIVTKSCIVTRLYKTLHYTQQSKSFYDHLQIFFEFMLYYKIKSIMGPDGTFIVIFQTQISYKTKSFFCLFFPHHPKSTYFCAALPLKKESASMITFKMMNK